MKSLFNSCMVEVRAGLDLYVHLINFRHRISPGIITSTDAFICKSYYLFWLIYSTRSSVKQRERIGKRGSFNSSYIFTSQCDAMILMCAFNQSPASMSSESRLLSATFDSLSQSRRTVELDFGRAPLILAGTLHALLSFRFLPDDFPNIKVRLVELLKRVTFQILVILTTSEQDSMKSLPTDFCAAHNFSRN